MDTDLQWRAPDNSLHDSASKKANDTFLKAMNDIGLDPSPGASLEKWVREAGFEDVHVKRMICPIGTWAADKKLVRNSITMDTDLVKPSSTNNPSERSRSMEPLTNN